MEQILFEKLQNLAQCKSLAEHDYLFNLADKTASVLENEKEEIRPKSKDKKAGGLLDFTNQTEKPLIIVPDLHARAYFMWHILNWHLPCGILNENLSVFQALEKGLVRVVLVGDLLHSELRGRKRWMDAWEEFMHRMENGPAMTEEMTEGLSLLCMVMELKCAFPEDFHILKGNHENINNARGHGDYPFCKFANEGEMVRIFMQTVYGDDVLFLIQCFEKALPLLAAFPSCLVSHAEPKRAFSKEELVDSSSEEEVVAGLTWTENNSAENGSVQKMIETFTKNGTDYSCYFGGHRPVQGKCALRQGGLFIQIHNPEQENVALVIPEKNFNPETDIHSVIE